jgi:tripartite-type tricarboxylate transporter receptor subunit TctC
MLKGFLAAAAALLLAACEGQVAQTPAQAPETAAADSGAAGSAYVPNPAADPNLFRGKTINYIVATGAGGGYDTYGRLIARYMQKHLPGSRILVRNVPGAGHIIGANTIYAARPDGTTVGMFNTGLIYNQLMNLPGVNFDLAKMTWIGKASNEIRVVIVSSKSGYRSFEEMLKSPTPVRFAAAGVGSAAYLDTRILDFVLPTLDIQTVSGFDGAEGELAMIRGDVAAQVGIDTSFEQFVRNKHGYMAATMSTLAKEKYPDVPLVADYVQDENGKKLLALLEALSDLGRLTAGPPGIPARELATLRDAHAKAIADPELLADARTLKVEITPGTGEFVEGRIKEALNQTPETVALLKQAESSQ